MNDLVDSLTAGIQPLTANKYLSTEEFEAALDRGYVLVEFPNTKGGTELGIRIDKEHSRFKSSDMSQGNRTVHLEGNMVLNNVKVRCIADINIEALAGTGCLVILEKNIQ